VDPDKAFEGGINSAILSTRAAAKSWTRRPVVPTNDIQIPPGAADTSNSGCDLEDFPGETASKVASIQCGTCAFYQKAENAKAAGAVARVIFNEGSKTGGASPTVP
jgi:hypothetical protein